jgi:hypothetical protein
LLTTPPLLLGLALVLPLLLLELRLLLTLVLGALLLLLLTPPALLLGLALPLALVLGPLRLLLLLLALLLLLLLLALALLFLIVLPLASLLILLGILVIDRAFRLGQEHVIGLGRQDGISTGCQESNGESGDQGARHRLSPPCNRPDILPQLRQKSVVGVTNLQHTELADFGAR